MKIYAATCKYDNDIYTPHLFATYEEAQTFMCMTICEYLERRDIVVKDNDSNISYTKENIPYIVENGFFVEEPDEISFYDFQTEDNCAFLNPYNTEYPTLQIEIFDVELPKAVCEAIFREQDAEAQLKCYLALSENVDLYDYLMDKYNEAFKDEAMVDSFIKRVVDIYEKKCDCNIDENSTWDIACEIALKEITNN